MVQKGYGRGTILAGNRFTAIDAGHLVQSSAIMLRNGAIMFGRGMLAAAMFALPCYAPAQVRSGVQSGVQTGVLNGVQSGAQSGVRSGFDHRADGNYTPRYRPAYSNCWRTTVTRGKRTVWNCQPYPPPPP